MATDWLMLRDEYLRTGVSLRALATLRGVGRKTLARAAADGGWAAMRRAAKRGATAARPGCTAAVEHRAGMAGAGKARAANNGAGRPARKTGTAASGQAARKTGVAASKQPARKTGAAASKQAASKPPPPQPTAPDADTLARLRAISGQLTDQLARAAGQLDKQVLKHRRKTRELVYDGGDPRAKPVEETVEEHCELEIVDVPVSCEGLQRLSSALKNLSDIVKTGGGDEQSVGMVAALMKKLDDEAAKGDG